MNRKKFIEIIKGYGFTSQRFSGSHEIFTSKQYSFNIVVPKAGKSEIRKGIYWNFLQKINKEKNETL